MGRNGGHLGRLTGYLVVSAFSECAVFLYHIFVCADVIVVMVVVVVVV
jgi:hypothetical protein